MPVTVDNFTVAWNAFTKRYENKRRLIEVHVATLYNLPTVSRESASELHALRDTAEKTITSLKRLDRSSRSRYFKRHSCLFCLAKARLLLRTERGN